MVHVEAQSLTRGDRAAGIRNWLALAYGGEVTGSLNPARPRVAARALLDPPDLLADDAYAACAAGNVAALEQMTAVDPGWVDRPGGPFKLPSLVAVTHSRLGQLPELRDRLIQSAQFLLQAGANPNQTIGNRFPPASLDAPDEKTPLSALYGAAGVNRDPALTKLLLDAGADPNDGESLYHALENPTARNCCCRAAPVCPEPTRCVVPWTWPTLARSNCCSLMAAIPTSPPMVRQRATGARRCCVASRCGVRHATSGRCWRPVPIHQRARRPASAPINWPSRWACRRWRASWEHRRGGAAVRGGGICRRLCAR